MGEVHNMLGTHELQPDKLTVPHAICLNAGCSKHHSEKSSSLTAYIAFPYEVQTLTCGRAMWDNLKLPSFPVHSQQIQNCRAELVLNTSMQKNLERLVKTLEWFIVCGTLQQSR